MTMMSSDVAIHFQVQDSDIVTITNYSNLYFQI